MSGKLSWLSCGVCIAAVCVSLATVALADTFGSGANQFDINFATIPGDAGDLGSWPAGDFRMTASEPYPQYTFTGVNRDDYRIGLCEITNDQWNKFKAELGLPVTGTPSDAYDAAPHWPGANVPMTMVSWYEAAQFVNWLNTSTDHQAAYRFTGIQGQSDYALTTWSPAEADNGTNLYRHKDAFYFLPTEPEWIKAGYWNGTSLQTWATPDDTPPIEGVEANYQSGAQPWGVASGSEELNGTFDMMGNVWEWMESPYSDTSYGAGANRGLRGGSYDFYGDSVDALASSNRYIATPVGEVNIGGFRVASDVPEPASLVLLSMGGLAMISRRRRS